MKNKTKLLTGDSDQKEVIHSGHFMVSDFDAIEAQDELSLEIPDADKSDDEEPSSVPKGVKGGRDNERSRKKAKVKHRNVIKYRSTTKSETLSIDSSLSKLFNAMGIAYRQKITSPKWNSFKGVKLRCKDKIRLNNVIWRCWHMQFMMKKKMNVCQFALDVDMHNKPEAIVMEGKYWKRHPDTVVAEYMKARKFYQQRLHGCDALLELNKDEQLLPLESVKSKSLNDHEVKWLMTVDEMDWPSPFSSGGASSSLFPDDLNGILDFNDDNFIASLFNQPYPFPNPREIARTGNSDLVQPGLVQLQPNLGDEFMDIEPLTEMLTGGGRAALPSVPEEEYYSNDVEAAALASSTSSPPNTHSPTQNNMEFMQAKLTNHIHMTPSTTTNNNNFSRNDISYQSPKQQSTPPYFSYTSPCQEFTSPTPSSTTLDNTLQYPPPLSTPKVFLPPTYDSNDQHPPPSIFSMNEHQLTPPAAHLSTYNIADNSNKYCSSTQPSNLSVKPPIQTPHHLQVKTSPSRLTVKSFSQQDLLNSSTGLMPIQASSSSPQLHTSPSFHHQPSTTLSNIVTSSRGSSSTAFVMPKPVARRRSYSSGSSTLATSRSSPPNRCNQTQYQLIQPREDTKLIGTTVTSSPVLIASKGGSQECHSPQRYLINPTTDVNSSQPLKLSLVIPPALIPIQSEIKPTQLTNGGSTFYATPVAFTTNSIFTNPHHAPASSTISSTSLHLSAVTPSSIKSISNPHHQAPTFSSGGSGGLYSITPNSLSMLGVHSSSPEGSSSGGGGQFSMPPHSFKSSPPHHACSPTPSPPSKSFRPKNDRERVQYREHRRVCHINAEKKRRCSIKNNFDVLHSLIPSLHSTSSSKISKAALLSKGADFIHQLKSDKQKLREQIDSVKGELEKLSAQISSAQAQLPATGAPLNNHCRHNQLEKMYQDYVRDNTLKNWRFYIFSMIGESLLHSFNNNVSTSSVEDLSRSSLAWLDQHCSLNLLRPVVSSTMLRLSTSTSVLASPQNLPEDIYNQVTKQEERSNVSTNSGSSSSSSRSNSLVRQ